MTTSGPILPPKLQKAELGPELLKLVEKSKKLYVDKLAYFAQNQTPPAYIVAAPGRVNLIGEHTDYTGGFVMPMAIDRYVVVYGTGSFKTGKGTAPTVIRIRCTSDQAESDIVEERRLTGFFAPPDESEPRTWVNYVLGVVAQYMPDMPPEGCHLDLVFAIAGDVPLGAGLSSSAALEVAVASFTEVFMHDLVFSSAPEGSDRKVQRALRCQKAENEWAHSPCGIMDQMISSAGQDGNLLLINCSDLSLTQVPWKQTPEDAVVLVTDSKVKHDIGDGAYGERRAQCNVALQAMQQVPLYHVLNLSDATVQDCKDAKSKMDEVSYKRAMHVVTENQRTKEAKIAVRLGTWERLGELMNASHASLKDDFEVSCDELDFLVDKAQAYDGVYGSRMTGGGFGGCTVTLVQSKAVEDLVKHLKEEYKAKFEKDCDCFVTKPGPGVRVLAIDMDCKQESDFFK
jgi:galactokinase